MLLTLFMLILSCPNQEDFDPDSVITFVNKSSQDILFDYEFGKYPDTALRIESPFVDRAISELLCVKANGIKVHPEYWITELEETKLPITIFLFSKDTVNKIPWTKIRNEYKILKRLELSRGELDSLNWQITYQ